MAAYRHAGGDPGDDSLLSFFAAYRAWVRAKVAALRAGELEAGDARTAAIGDARAFACTARRFAWRARGPRPLVVCGASATGKTHLARRLAAVSGWRHLSSDVVRKQSLGLDPERRAPARAYTPSVSESTYAELGRLARAELDAGSGAIVDATFRFRRDRDAFARGLGGARCGPLFFECRAPAAELARRAAERERDARRVSDAGLEQVELQPREFEPLAEVPEADRETLRTDRLWRSWQTTSSARWIPGWPVGHRGEREPRLSVRSASWTKRGCRRAAPGNHSDERSLPHVPYRPGAARLHPLFVQDAERTLRRGSRSPR